MVPALISLSNYTTLQNKVYIFSIFKNFSNKSRKVRNPTELFCKDSTDSFFREYFQVFSLRSRPGQAYIMETSWKKLRFIVKRHWNLPFRNCLFQNSAIIWNLTIYRGFQKLQNLLVPAKFLSISDSKTYLMKTRVEWNLK